MCVRFLLSFLFVILFAQMVFTITVTIITFIKFSRVHSRVAHNCDFLDRDTCYLFYSFVRLFVCRRRRCHRQIFIWKDNLQTKWYLLIVFNSHTFTDWLKYVRLFVCLFVRCALFFYFASPARLIPFELVWKQCKIAIERYQHQHELHIFRMGHCYCFQEKLYFCNWLAHDSAVESAPNPVSQLRLLLFSMDCCCLLVWIILCKHFFILTQWTRAVSSTEKLSIFETFQSMIVDVW